MNLAILNSGGRKTNVLFFAIGAIVVAAALLAVSRSWPASSPGRPAIIAIQPNGNAQHIHDALLSATLVAPVGFKSPTIEEGDLSDFDKKDGVALRVHVAFVAAQSAGIAFIIFNSPAQAKAYGDDFMKNVARVGGTRVSSPDAPDAVCADSKSVGGFCGFVVGQTFIMASSDTVANGAGPLMAAAHAAFTTANP